MSPAANSSRWCPTPEQLMILEEMYRSGTRTPNASQIQQITAHLSFYGKIEGKNVFYWFQNHKARDRQKLRRKLYKQLQQQQQQLIYQHQHQHQHQNMMVNHANHLFLQNNHFLDSPLGPFVPQLQGGVFEDHQHHNHNQAQSSYNHHHDHQMVTSHNWKMEIPANNGDHHHHQIRLEKEKCMVRSVYDRDWMMMFDDAAQESPTSLNNNSKPIKTLELFPIKSTNLKEDSTTSYKP